MEYKLNTNVSKSKLKNANMADIWMEDILKMNTIL